MTCGCSIDAAALDSRDEARAEVGVVGERRGDDLQRDRAVQVEVRRAVHDAHPATSGESRDAVVDEDVTWAELRHVPVVLALGVRACTAAATRAAP